MKAPDRNYFLAMERRALAKLEGDDGFRAWLAWAKVELPREYACRERYNRGMEAESNLKIARMMLAAPALAAAA